MNGMPLLIDPPFAIPEETTASVDAFGRPIDSVDDYTYLDTSKSLLGGLTGSLIPLLDPTVQGPPGNPNNWMQEHETLMYALAGAYLLYGNRVPATYDYGTEGPGGQKVSYSGFDPAASPLPDLLHAAGQVLADSDSDAILLSVLDLLQNHQSTVARLMGAVLNLRRIAANHDAAAAAGTEPLASLAYNVPIWDEMAQVVWAITQKPGLMTALLGAMADPTTVTPYGNATNMGDAISRFAHFKDQLDVRQARHPLRRLGPRQRLPRRHQRARGQPHRRPQRQRHQRSQDARGQHHAADGHQHVVPPALAPAHPDANGGPACNKNGASVAAKIGRRSAITCAASSAAVRASASSSSSTTWAYFYLDSLLAGGPPQAQLPRRSSRATLNDLLAFLERLHQRGRPCSRSRATSPGSPSTPTRSR